jgi:hypothetical protein
VMSSFATQNCGDLRNLGREPMRVGGHAHGDAGASSESSGFQ